MKNWKKGIALVVAAGLLTIAGAATALAASKTKLDTVTELYWGDDGTTANWEKVDDAYQYEVRLYCNESQVESMKTKMCIRDRGRCGHLGYTRSRKVPESMRQLIWRADLRTMRKTPG